MALNLNNPVLMDKWDDLAGEKSDTNFVIFGQGANGALEIKEEGKGGYDEMKSKLDDNAVQFVALKVYAIDRRENLTSKRPKVVACCYVGPSVSVLKKARAGPTYNEIKTSLFRGVAATFDAFGSLDDFSREAIKAKLLASTGAHKPSEYVFGPNENDTLPVEFYTGSDR